MIINSMVVRNISDLLSGGLWLKLDGKDLRLILNHLLIDRWRGEHTMRFIFSIHSVSRSKIQTDINHEFKEQLHETN